jgi:uncharacterized membrane protein
MRAEGTSTLGAARAVALAALVFAAVGLTLQWWRLHSLTASYDQGIFLQVLWNGLRGHPFESTLSSQLSSSVIHDGQLPAVGYHRLGQHFTPALMLWAPLVAILGPLALPFVQVGLMSGAGLVLHRLASLTLGDPRLAAFLACSFYAANAVIGPTWGNFTDLCQLPIAVFLLMLGLRQRWGWLTAVMALLIPLIREDTGVVLVGVAVWLLLRHPSRWPVATLMGLYGGGWVVLVTTVLMPMFSEDTSRRFMVENFGHFIGGRNQAGSLEVLSSALRQPWILLKELVSPPGQTLRYLLAQTLPLLFLPLLSLDCWMLMGLPLMGLLLAQGKPSPLSVNVRYALLVVPGLFAGAVLWWERHLYLFRSRRMRSLWIGAMVLSILFTLISNPHRSLSALIPDSMDPWIHSSPAERWRQGMTARRLLRAIPPSASVSASTHLVPLLARREVLVRFPGSVSYLDRDQRQRDVDWIAIDVDGLQRFLAVSRGDQKELGRILRLMPDLLSRYGIHAVQEGLVLLEKGGSTDPGQAERLRELLTESRRRLGEAGFPTDRLPVDPVPKRLPSVRRS